MESRSTQTCYPPRPCPCAPQVQLQLLTATVKLFLKKPTERAQSMISAVLSCATSETDNPDLRDRAYIYWRLLSTDPEVGPLDGGSRSSGGWGKGALASVCMESGGRQGQPLCAHQRNQYARACAA